MQDSNPEGLLVQHNTSFYREVREFERFTIDRVTHTTKDMGLIKNVGVPVNTPFVLYGKIRPVKRFEFERIAGIFDDGSLVFEFRMPMRSKLPHVRDKIEKHGVQSRQPRMRYLVTQILPDLTLLIGRALITPIGNEGEPENT